MIPASFKRAKVRRVVRLSGSDAPVELYRRKGRKKKTTRGLAPAERLLRQVARANEATSSEFLRRLDTSRTKKRDGALRDGPRNTLKALRKGSKKIRLLRVL